MPLGGKSGPPGTRPPAAWKPTTEPGAKPPGVHGPDSSIATAQAGALLTWGHFRSVLGYGVPHRVNRALDAARAINRTLR
jgi:hypothetical protein